MRVILVGTGFWGSGWARVVHEYEHTELAAIVDVNPVALAGAGDAITLPADRRFASLDAALAQVEADAGLVVVPPEVDAEVAVAFLEAGLDVLVEKPFAPSVEEAAEIVRRAEELGRTVMVTQSFRFKRGPQTVRKLVREGAVGAIEAVEGRFAKAPHFGGFREEMDEPLIVDLSIHHFDFLRGILRLEPVRVRARSFNPSWSWFRGNAAAFVEFETDDGAQISYNGSWVSKSRETSWDGSWEIQGAEGSIVWEHNRVEYRSANFGLTVYRKDMLERGEGVMDVPLVALEDEERAGTLLEFITARREGPRAADERRGQPSQPRAGVQRGRIDPHGRLGRRVGRRGRGAALRFPAAEAARSPHADLAPAATWHALL